jgi:hypothetical protein
MIENVTNNQPYSDYLSGNDLLINPNPIDYYSNAPQVPIPQNQEPLIQETPFEPSNNLEKNQNQNELVQYPQNNQEQNQNETQEEPQMVLVPDIVLNNNAKDFLTRKQIIIRIICIILLVLYLIYDIINQTVIKGKINIGMADDALLFILGIIIFICLLFKIRSEHFLIFILGLLNCVLGITFKLLVMLDVNAKIYIHDIILLVIRIIILGFIFIITIPETCCKRCCLDCNISSNHSHVFGHRSKKRFGHIHNHGFGINHGRAVGRSHVGGFGRSHGRRAGRSHGHGRR